MRYFVVAVGKSRPPFEDDLRHYSKALQRRIPERAWVCLIDSRGRSYSSEAFAGWLEERRQAGRDVCFVIGGAFGTELAGADHTLSFGPATLPHLLARVVLLEQLYRGHKILANEPYHH